MHLSLDINDSKAQQFVAFLKTLDFVKINDNESDIAIPEAHISILEERLESYYKNSDQLKDARTSLNEIKRRL